MPANGFTGNVAFSVSGLGFRMGSLLHADELDELDDAPGDLDLVLVAQGTRTLTITGTSGGTSRTVQVQLTLT